MHGGCKGEAGEDIDERDGDEGSKGKKDMDSGDDKLLFELGLLGE